MLKLGENADKQTKSFFHIFVGEAQAILAKANAQANSVQVIAGALKDKVCILICNKWLSIFVGMFMSKEK